MSPILEASAAILAIHVSYPNARLVPKVESRISSHGDIVAQLYLRAPDKNQRWIIRSASYVVIANDLRTLKITLTQLKNNDNLIINF